MNFFFDNINLRDAIKFCYSGKLNMKKTIAVQDIANKLHFSIENTYKILEIFYESSQTILNNLETAIQENDFDKIYRHAHSIKGSSSNLLFDDVYAIAKEIEQSAQEQTDYPYLEKVTEIRTIIKNTKIV